MCIRLNLNIIIKLEPELEPELEPKHHLKEMAHKLLDEVPREKVDECYLRLCPENPEECLQNEYPDLDASLLDPPPEKEKIIEILNHLDLDCDGSISIEESKKLFSQLLGV